MAYCTCEDFYEYTDLDETAVSSAKVQKFIDRAYQEVNNLTNTYFSTTVDLATTISETLDPTPLQSSEAETYLVLSKYPVAQLSSVSLGGTSYATSNFIVYTDRIAISPNATSVSTFGTDKQYVTVVYKYGVVDSDKFGAAKQLNILLAVLDFVTTPFGRNTYIDNFRGSEINQNNVRPADPVEAFINGLRTQVDKLKDELGKAHQFS